MSNRVKDAPAGRAASLMSLLPAELVLKSEAVEFVFLEDQRAFRVNARFDVVNPSQRQVSAQLALPEVSCGDESEFDDACDPSRAAFTALEVVVGERRLRLRKGRLPGPARDAEPQSGWLLPLRWQAAQALTLQFQYLVPAGESTEGGFSVNYQIRGAASWAKPVGHATFKFAFPARSCLIVEPEQLARRSRRVVLIGDEPWLEAVYEAYVWNPPSEVGLYFEPCVAPRDTEMAGCSAASDLARFFYPAQSNEEVEPIDEGTLRKVLDQLPDDELARCRDGVFATYASYFAADELKRLPTHPQAVRHYTAPLLTAADWRWVHFLDVVVAKRQADAKRRAAQQRQAAAKAAHRGCGCRLVPSPAHGGERERGAVLILAVALACRLGLRRYGKRTAACARK